MDLIQYNVPLAPLTTMKLGGPARYFAKVDTIAQLKAAIKTAEAQKWTVLVLAAGSNVILSDEPYDGLVIQIAIGGSSLHNTTLKSGPATSMKTLVDSSIKAGLAGLEWAGGLPGSVGGAIRGNAGAFKGEIKDTVFSVRSLNLHSLTERDWSSQECRFVYRGSIFKDHPEEIIVEASLRLQPGDPKVLREIADSHIQFRATRHPLEYPNAGSIFKNVPVEKVPADVLRKYFEAFIKVDPFPIVPAGKIIEDAGLKGYQIGDAQVSEKHCNYIVNRGRATAADVLKLIDYIKETVLEQFGVRLEVEPYIVAQKG